MPDLQSIIANGALLRRSGAGSLDDVTPAEMAADPAFTGKYVDQGVVGLVAAPTGVAAADTAAIQAAINALPAGGGTVVLQRGTYALNARLVGGPKVRLVGQGMRATVLSFSGTGYAILMGNTVLGTALAYGCGVEDLAIVLTATGGSGITLVETAMATVRNVYVEGVVTTNTSTGVFVDGGNTSNIFTRLDNVLCNHIKFGHKWASTGTSYPTSIVATNCSAFADAAAGSIGLFIDAPAQGNRWFGGNLESCATGLSITGHGNMFAGARFEGNTLDVLFNASAKGNVLSDALEVITITDNSTNATNSVRSRTAATGAPVSQNDGRSVILSLPVGELAVGPDGTLNGQNGVYQDLDLLSAIPAGCKAAILDVCPRDSSAGSGAYVRIKKKGAASGGFQTGAAARVAAQTFYTTTHVVCPVDASGVIQYQPNGFGATTGELYIDVIGYIT